MGGAPVFREDQVRFPEHERGIFDAVIAMCA